MEIWSQQVEREQQEEVRILAEVLDASPAFWRFYESERSKIVWPVEWHLNAALPEGVRGEVLNDPDRRVHVIRLPREDSPADLALIIAEEMEHALQYEAGFPMLVHEGPGTEYLAAVMNSMLCDPVAHARMRMFGLDYSGILEEEQKRSMAELDGRAEPPGRLSRFWWMANHAANVLDCREVGVEDVFSPWFDARYPITAERAKGLVRRVESLGFETPGQQVRVWREVIRRYELEGEVRVVRMGKSSLHPVTAAGWR